MSTEQTTEGTELAGEHVTTETEHVTDAGESSGGDATPKETPKPTAEERRATKKVEILAAAQRALDEGATLEELKETRPAWVIKALSDEAEPESAKMSQKDMEASFKRLMEEEKQIDAAKTDLAEHQLETFDAELKELRKTLPLDKALQYATLAATQVSAEDKRRKAMSITTEVGGKTSPVESDEEFVLNQKHKSQAEIRDYMLRKKGLK